MPRKPLEQGHAELRFEPANLLGDGALRHAELFGGKPEVQVARRDFEGFEAIEDGSFPGTSLTQ